MWLTKADQEAAQTVVLDLDGGQVTVNVEQLDQIIKKKLLEVQAVRRTLEDFEIDPERLNDLAIQLVELEGKYAETDINTMKINPSVFAEGHFFRDYFFVIVHELVHWMSRIKENDAYFNDPEEVLGFTLSIAYEMEQGSDFDVIWNKIYPKIQWHFHDESDAREFFTNMMQKARKLLRS